MATTHAPDHRPGHARREIAVLLGLTVIAAAIRVWRLGDLPPGLHVDEAYNVLDARAVLAGWRPVFLPANAGREVLYTYLQAPLLAALGESPATARLASALAGVLAVPATWWFARGLPFRRPARVAALSAAFVALSYWHLHFSRFGIRAVLFPLVVAMTLGLWWRLAAPGGEGGGQGRRWPVIAALGLLLGAAVYAHPAGRALVAIPALDATFRWLRRRDSGPARRLLPAAALALVVALPVTLFWAQNPALFGSHAGEVSILRQGPTAVAVNALKVAAMHNVAGDPAGWRNLIDRPALERLLVRVGDPGTPALPVALRGRPVFDVVAGLLFLLGLAMTVATCVRARRSSPGCATDTEAPSMADACALVLIALAVLLLPSVLTDAAPNFSRAIGAIPLICLFPALALDAVAEGTRARWGRTAAAATIVGTLALSGASTLHGYFVLWAGSGSTPFSFDADKVALARYLDDAASEGRAVYVSAATAAHPTVRVSSSGMPRGFDPSLGLVLPGTAPARAEYVFLDTERDSSARDMLSAQLARFGVGTILQPLDLPLSPPGADATPYTLPPSARLWRVAFAPSDAVHDAWPLPAMVPGAVPVATFGSVVVPTGRSDQAGAQGGLRHGRDSAMDGAISLAARRAVPAVVRPGGTITVTLLWQAMQSSARDLTTFVHLVGADGTGVADADAPPLGGTYPTTSWQPGEWIVNDYTMRVPREVMPGPYEIRVGWYDGSTGRRLAAGGPLAGLREDETAYTIGTVPIVGK